jgi:hypothetical protein
MVELTYQMVLSTIQTLSLVVGIIYYLGILRNTQKTRELTLESQELTRKAQEQALETRQAQLFMSIYTRANEVEFWKNYREIIQWEWESFEEYNEKYILRPEMWAKWNSLGTFFEGMGVMVKRHHIDVTVVDDLLSGPIMSLWQKFEPTILENGRRRNMPTIWEWFGYLYEEVRKTSEKEHGVEHVVDVGRLYKPYESNRT